MKHHANTAADNHGVQFWIKNTFIFQHNVAGKAGGGNGFVHPVKTADQGGFAAARRADNGGDFFLIHVHIHIKQSLFVAEPGANPFRLHFNFLYRAHFDFRMRYYQFD